MTIAQISADFEAALAKSRAARAAWNKLAPGHRREHLEAIEEAKRPETRARRIAKAIEMLDGDAKRPVAASTSGLAAKLGVKPGMLLAMLNAPPEATELLGTLPDDATLSTRMSGDAAVVVLFARDSADLAKRLPTVASRLGPDAVLWVGYPKKAARIATDLHRDTLNAAMQDRGYQGNLLVSMSDAWAVMRFKRV